PTAATWNWSAPTGNGPNSDCSCPAGPLLSRCPPRPFLCKEIKLEIRISKFETKFELPKGGNDQNGTFVSSFLFRLDIR
ncbi:MAG: hypothetical protein DMF06_06215, partial [Verrucomicrobia bacterium]